MFYRITLFTHKKKSHVKVQILSHNKAFTGFCSFQYTASSARERKTTAHPKQEVSIPKPIAQYTRTRPKREKVTAVLHLIKGEVSTCSVQLITSSAQQIRVIKYYQCKIRLQSSSMCPHLPTYLDTYTETL